MITDEQLREQTQKTLENVQDTLKKGADQIKKDVTEMINNGMDEKSTQIEELNKKVDKMNSSIDETQNQIKRINECSIPGAEKETKDFSLQMFLRGILEESSPKTHGNAWKKSGLEKEVYDAYLKTNTGKKLVHEKSLNIDSDGSLGAYLVVPEVSEKIIGLVYASIPLLDKLPVTKINGLVGPFDIPTVTSGTTAYMTGENSAPTESNPTYGKIEAREKRVAAFCRQSKRLIYNSRGVAEKILLEDMKKQMSVKIHEMLLKGTGSEYQPLGLLNQSGDMTSTSVSIGDNGGRFNITHAKNMEMDIDVANELSDNPNNYGYLFRPEVKFGLSSERVTQYSGATTPGMPILGGGGGTPHISDDALKGIIGNFATTTQIGKTESKGTSSTLSKAIYGNWSYFWILFWEGMTLRMSDQASDGTNHAFLQNQMFYIIEQGFNCALTRATAFTQIEEAETTTSNF